MNVFIKLTPEARREHFVRTGEDPGSSLPLAMDIPPGLRKRLAPHIKQSSNYEARDGVPKGSMYCYLHGLQGTTPEALSLALDDIDAKHEREQREQKEREEQMALKYARKVTEARQADLEELIYVDGITGPRRVSGYSLDVLEDAGRREEVEMELARLTAERAEQKARLKAEREEAKRQKEAEKADWIGSYGSARLQRLAREGIELDAVYRDERLAKEAPGWTWEGDLNASIREPRNASEEALALLDEARKMVAGAKLGYLVVPACDPGCPDHEDYYADDPADDPCPGQHDGWRGYVAHANLLDEGIVFGAPQ